MVRGNPASEMLAKPLETVKEWLKGLIVCFVSLPGIHIGILIPFKILTLIAAFTFRISKEFRFYGHYTSKAYNIINCRIKIQSL